MLYSVIIFYEGAADFQVARPVPEKAVKLKSECCEKYKKGKRCKRCPCFDLL